MAERRRAPSLASAAGAKAEADAMLRVEQLRLLLGNMGSSLAPTIAVGLLVVLTLSASADPLHLWLWYGAVLSSKLFATWDAHRTLAAGIKPAAARRRMWWLVGLNALDGAAWGALAWVALDHASLAGSILVFAVITGTVGNSMSLLSPVLPVFIAFCIFELGALAFKVSLMGDPAYHALGLAAVVYMLGLFSQARNSASAARAALRLRFENVELIQQLRVETGKARAALATAEEANLAKSKFLAAASHDLRQPIHAQGLFLEVLDRSELTASQREVLACARSASEASAGMLHTLLDFSRIEAGVVEAHVQPFRLQPLLNQIESELAPQANLKGLVYRTRETAAALLSDGALVELILRNLVSNAVRYTERGGILVACRLHGAQAVLEVWDTGIGIAPAQQQEVFREFHQLGNPERDRQKGLGLGLSIAQGLARILGHQLTLASRPGRGSVFRLHVPLAPQVPAPDVAKRPADQARTLNLRVLVIDDDASVCASMLGLLREWGCRCEAADGIVQALELAPALAPQLVISDYRLRGQQTGGEAIVALREALGQDLAALLITGDTAPARLREALAGGVPLLHKPVAPAQLYARLAQVQERLEGAVASSH